MLSTQFPIDFGQGKDFVMLRTRVCQVCLGTWFAKGQLAGDAFVLARASRTVAGLALAGRGKLLSHSPLNDEVVQESVFGQTIDRHGF